MVLNGQSWSLLRSSPEQKCITNCFLSIVYHTRVDPHYIRTTQVIYHDPQKGIGEDMMQTLTVIWISLAKQNLKLLSDICHFLTIFWLISEHI